MIKTQKTFLYFVIAFILIMPMFVYAETATPIKYTPIEDIPFVGKQSEFTAYLKAIFQFGIAAIAIVSVITIMIGGYLYIFSGGSKEVEKAKSMVVNALLGLGLALVSWIIVYTINPDLVELKKIRSAKINIDQSTMIEGGGNGSSIVCDVREAKWKINQAAVGSIAVMSFNLPLTCTEKTSEITLEVEIKEDDIVGDDFVAKFELSKSKGEIVQTELNGSPSFIWEGKWEIPPILENGDEIYFTVRSKTTIDEQVKTGSLKKSINNLSITSGAVSLCKIKQVNWILPPTKADRTGIDAEFGARTDFHCRELDKVTKKNKFALKIEIYNRENGQDEHAKPSGKVFEHIAELDDNLVQMPFIIPPPEPRPEGFEGTYLKTRALPGNYFIEATVVYADNHSRPFTSTMRSTRGKDLEVE